MSEEPWYQNVVIGALLRHARHAYGGPMRRALAEEGLDDIPGNGLYVIGGLALAAGEGVPISEFVRGLRVSKQAAGQLIDQLVLRGYVERTPDPEDRRQVLLTLTERGEAAALTQTRAREAVDAELRARVGAETVREMRKGLGALAEMAQQGASD